MKVSKYIALDTAQIGDWCRDRVSPKKDLQDAVMEFESAFLGGGHVLVLTLHHIIELLRATPDVALKRVEFLALLPKVAWPRSRMKDGHSPAQLAQLQGLTMDTPEVRKVTVGADGKASVKLPMASNDVVLVTLKPA